MICRFLIFLLELLTYQCLWRVMSSLVEHAADKAVQIYKMTSDVKSHMLSCVYFYLSNHTRFDFLIELTSWCAFCPKQGWQLFFNQESEHILLDIQNLKTMPAVSLSVAKCKKISLFSYNCPQPAFPSWSPLSNHSYKYSMPHLDKYSVPHFPLLK